MILRYLFILALALCLTTIARPASADFIRVEEYKGKCEIPKDLKPVQRLNGYALYLSTVPDADGQRTVFVKKNFAGCLLMFPLQQRQGREINYSNAPLELWSTYHPTAPYGKFGQVVADRHQIEVASCSNYKRCDQRFDRMLKRSVGIRLRYKYDDIALSDWIGFLMGDKGWYSVHLTPQWPYTLEVHQP